MYNPNTELSHWYSGEFLASCELKNDQ